MSAWGLATQHTLSSEGPRGLGAEPIHPITTTTTTKNTSVQPEIRAEREPRATPPRGLARDRQE